MPIPAVIYRRQDLITVTSLARRWGVSRQKVYNLIDEGKLTTFRFGFSRVLHVPLSQVKTLEMGAECSGDI